MDLIQQWGLRFENNQAHPLFNKIYVALKGRMDGFPDENKVRVKLGMRINTPVKEQNQRSNYNDNRHQQSPLDSVPVQDHPSARRKKNKVKKQMKMKKKVSLNRDQKSKKMKIDNIVESMSLANSMIDAAEPDDRD